MRGARWWIGKTKGDREVPFSYTVAKAFAAAASALRVTAVHQALDAYAEDDEYDN
jgi:hypothetical protein